MKIMKKITLITILLSVFAIINAQENSEILGADSVLLVPRNELILTQEIREMLDTSIFSRMKNWSDQLLSMYGIKNREQLNSLQFGKPIPLYALDNGKLRFLNSWRMLVLSDGEPLHFVTVDLEEDGQYGWGGSGSALGAPIFYNYEHKDLIIGKVEVYPEHYFIIRKDNKDIFVKSYDYKTRKQFSGEYSLPDIINLIKE